MLKLPPAGSEAAWEEAARTVQRGGVLAMPTESFYGLGASPLNEDAVRRVGIIKGRLAAKPILVLISALPELDRLAAEVPPGAAVLIKRFWPGPLTIIFPAARSLPDALTGGTGTVGVRQTAYPLLVELLRHVGPLTGTSANRAGEPPARTAEEVRRGLGADLDLILDSGPTPGGVPSTIVHTVGALRLLREGLIPRGSIEVALAGAGLALTA
jgi:L-threonylcarbamoyladenylate synthase